MICEIICVAGFLCMSNLDIVHISSAYVHVICILSEHMCIMCILSAAVLDIFLPNRQCQCHPYIISSTLYIFYHGEYVICTPSRWCVIHTSCGWHVIRTPCGWRVIRTPCGWRVIRTPCGWRVIRTPCGWRVIRTPSGWQVICIAKKHVLPLWSLRSN